MEIIVATFWKLKTTTSWLKAFIWKAFVAFKYSLQFSLVCKLGRRVQYLYEETSRDLTTWETFNVLQVPTITNRWSCLHSEPRKNTFQDQLEWKIKEKKIINSKKFSWKINLGSVSKYFIAFYDRLWAQN